MRFLIDPDLISITTNPVDSDEMLVSYCGVFVSGFTFKPAKLVPDVSRQDAARVIEMHLDDLSAHERLALIGKFLDARHGQPDEI